MIVDTIIRIIIICFKFINHGSFECIGHRTNVIKPNPIVRDLSLWYDISKGISLKKIMVCYDRVDNNDSIDDIDKNDDNGVDNNDNNGVDGVYNDDDDDDDYDDDGNDDDFDNDDSDDDDDDDDSRILYR